MKIPDKPENEADRLNALYEYNILDTDPEKEFDELVKLASQICEVPISLVTLVDVERQWFKASVGVDVSETPRNVSFCAHAIHDDRALIVRDAKEDERFADNPLVQQEPNLRFYAGVPLISPQGYRLGTLCVIDTKARDLSEKQLSALEVLSRQVTKQMDLMLTNRKLNESFRKLRKQNNELEKLNMTNNKLLSIISHDLRSPFSSMEGFLELLNQGVLSEEEIHKSSKSLKKLMISSSDLLENLIQWGASRITTDELQLQKMNLATLTDEIIAAMELTAREKQNHIVSMISRSQIVEADSVMLRFILRNLIQNANKFTNDGLIEISAKETDREHMIFIKDNGLGIDPERKDVLFDWERRMSTPGTSGEKGSGLGLLLCKEFVENHGGRIKLKSKVGLGSEFSFSISKDL